MTEPTPLRLRRPPVLDGPYDDERRPVPQVAGSLALALPGLERPEQRMPLRLVPPAQAPAGAGPCPALQPLVTRLAQAIVEVLAGARPPAQLASHATYDVLCQLERSAGRLVGRRPAATTRPHVTSLHVGEPRPRVAEVCVVFDTGHRRRAMALRLEAAGAAWQCTALQLG